MNEAHQVPEALIKHADSIVDRLSKWKQKPSQEFHIYSCLEFGEALLLSDLYKICGKETYKDTAVTAINLLTALPNKYNQLGIEDGEAGKMLLLLRLFEMTNESQHLANAMDLAKGCLTSLEKIPLRDQSFFKGSAGLLFAATKLCEE